MLPIPSWHCNTCRIKIPLYKDINGVRHSNNPTVVKHLKTKKHKKYQDACPRCRSIRKMMLLDECWDSDGIRKARKCVKCKTEFKCYASGKTEKTDPNEYAGELPKWLIDECDKNFHEEATRRGYTKANALY